MSFEDRIRKAYPNMSKSFLKLADYLVDSYIEVSFMTASQLAHAVDVDTTTVVRFSQSLGYAGYPDLLGDVREKVKSQLLVVTKPPTQAENAIGVVDSAMQNLGEVLRRAYMLLDVDSMEQLVEQIGAARQIFLAPDALAQPAALTLANLLTPGRFAITIVPNSVTELARAVHLAAPNDLLLAQEVAGETPYIARALASANAKGVPTAAIVGAPSLDSARQAHLLVATQTPASSGLGMVLMNTVAYALAEMVRWKYEERFTGADASISELSNKMQSQD